MSVFARSEQSWILSCISIMVQDSETQQINSTPKPRTGFMRNDTITDVHQRVQLRSDLTNPYVKFFSFKEVSRNPWLRLFPETKQNPWKYCWNHILILQMSRKHGLFIIIYGSGLQLRGYTLMSSFSKRNHVEGNVFILFSTNIHFGMYLCCRNQT